MRRSKLYRYASDAIDHGRQYAFAIAASRSGPSALSGRFASMPLSAPLA